MSRQRGRGRPVGRAGQEEVERGSPGRRRARQQRPGVPAQALAVRQLHAQVEQHVQHGVAEQHHQHVPGEVAALLQQPAECRTQFNAVVCSCRTVPTKPSSIEIIRNQVPALFSFDVTEIWEISS